MKTKWPLFASMFLLLVVFVPACAQTADEIIGKHITAIGGADNWKKINTIKKVASVFPVVLRYPLLLR